MSWQQQKAYSLAQVPQFGYAVGPGYDAIPARIATAGFGEAFDDLARYTATAHAGGANLPQHPQQAGIWHDKKMGFRQMDDRYVSEDLAPIFIKAPVNGLYNIGGMLSVLSTESGFNMPNGARVLETRVHQPTSGHPLGVQTSLAPEYAKEGQQTYIW